LGLFHIPFTVHAADIDETTDPACAPADEVARLSLAKARAIPCQDDDVVIAADTIVVLDGRVLGKPATQEEAKAMLRALSGQAHQVMTGVAVLRGEESLVYTEITDIRFRVLSDAEIAAYVATGEPMDKAGAYGIQGGAALFAEYLQGDYYNVMGLPVCRLWKMLSQIAPKLLEKPVSQEDFA
jgi:septum formation protein